MSGLRLLFIGESIVLAGAIELARRRGHQIVGILATAPGEAAAMARAGLPVQTAEGGVAGFVASHDCDVLFSILNGRILKADALARPRLAAVNYHNAPLPTYAGMWATAWAVLNGEASHGVTWHLMEPGIDTGAILAQQSFTLSEKETTASLNARCSQVAIESLERVFQMLETGDTTGLPQDAASRTYHRRTDVAPNEGSIDWRWSAERIVRLVRACDWGPTPSEFGAATLSTPTLRRIVVRSAELASGHAAPGLVLAREGDAVTIACGEGAVRLSVERSTELLVGQSLPITPIRRDALAPEDQLDVHTFPQDTSARDMACPNVVDRISALATAEPEAPAIKTDDRVISRGDLASRAGAIAGALVAAGLQPGAGVGVLLPAGIEFVVSALGAMAAGGAYVPLDPSSPAARHVVETDEAGVTHVLTTRALTKAAEQTGLIVIAVDEEAQSEAGPGLSIAAETCAYRVFTSGSTGRPKAVEVTHGALANLVAHYVSALPMSSSDRMTMLAHPTFDASVADIWPVLAAGGTLLVPPPQTLLDPGGLIAWLAATSATYAFVPTAVAERIFDRPWPESTVLRALLTGGDTLHRHPPAGLPFRVINTYGPTENTVDSLWAVIGPGGGRPLIGRPIAGVTAEVVDTAAELVLPGEVGELVLGGAQVARGYRGRPELTAKSFRHDPSSPGAKRYHTGDLVRIDHRGDFEFHGRIDDQLQLLGVRVEPGEIEAIIRSDSRVAEAVCLPLRAGTEVTGLIAYVVPATGFAPGVDLPSALRATLAEHLPPGIIPKRIEVRAELPRTAAGKINRPALVEASAASVSSDPAETDALRAIWLRLLPGAADALDEESFWDLGGDSLAAIELLLAVEKSTGVRVPTGLFLADPSLAGLRGEVAARRNPTVLRFGEGQGPPLLFWYGPSGDLEHYQHLTKLLSDRNVFGVLSPALADPTQTPACLEDAVACGLASLRQFGVFEPPALLGYSWSGLLAFEAARQLAHAGTPAPFVGLVGGLPPFRRRGLAARLAHLARWGPVGVLGLINGTRRPPKRLRKSIKRLLRLLAPDGDLPETPGFVKRPLQEAHIQMGLDYQPQSLQPIKLHLFRELRTQIDHLGYAHYDKADLGWSAWAGFPPTVQWIDATHHDLMRGKSVAEVAASLREQLDELT